MNFAERLRRSLGDRSVYSIAKASGLQQSLVGRYLSGAVTPGHANTALLAKALNVRFAWLATGEGEMRDEAEHAIRLRFVMPGGGEARVAKTAGIAPELLARYLAGKLPTPAHFAALAKALNVLPAWLETGAEPMSPPGAVRPKGTALPEFIPAARERAPGADFGGEQPIYVAPLTPRETGLVLSRRVLAEAGIAGLDELAAMWVADDSMAPTLRRGDRIIIDTRKVTGPLPAGVYVFRAGKQLLIRRVAKRMDGSLETRADNPAQPSGSTLTEADLERIAGRALLKVAAL